MKPFIISTIICLMFFAAVKAHAAPSLTYLGNASSTALSANVFCLTADTCRTTWPGSSTYDAWTHPSAGVSATTSSMIFTNASSTFTGNLNITGNSTTTNATTTNLFSTTASSTNLFSSLLTVGGTGLVVDSSRNVAIGFASPANKLDVGGNVSLGSGSFLGFMGNAAVTSSNYSLFGNTTLTLLNARSGASIGFRINNTDVANFTTTGGFGFGNTFYNLDPGQNNMIVEGNLGVGIAVPTERLHVSGNLLVTGNSTTTNATTTNFYTGVASSSAYFGNWQGDIISPTYGGLGANFGTAGNGALYWSDSLDRALVASSFDALGAVLTGDLAIDDGGTNATSQTTNGVNYFDGTSITSGSSLTFNGSLFTAPNASTTALTVADYFKLPVSASPSLNPAGTLALDSTSNNLVLATSTTGHIVAASATTTLYGLSVASTSPDFISGGIIEFPTHFLPQVATAVICKVDAGTSVVINLSDGTNDTNTITCTTTETQYTLTSNNSFTAYERVRLEVGTVTGSVDYLVMRFVGYRTSD